MFVYFRISLEFLSISIFLFETLLCLIQDLIPYLIIAFEYCTLSELASKLFRNAIYYILIDLNFYLHFGCFSHIILSVFPPGTFPVVLVNHWGILT